MNVGSLFSGVGGMDYGLARAGFRHVFFCESDEWRRSVLAHHWPGVPIYDDVGVLAREPDARADERGAGRVGGRDGSDAVDLLCGGFPCQDLSVAGKRRGLAGDRSGLFFEFARIIELVQPGWVLIENVPGLLSSNGGRDFGIVLGTLADLGYGVAWRVLDSRFFGVPQRRRRVFIVGARAHGDPRAAAQRAGQVLAVGTRCPGHPATRREARESVAPALSGRSASRLDDQGSGQLVPQLARALMAEGHDASEDGTGRGTPLIAAFSENQRAEVLETPIARQLTSGGGKPGQGYSAVRYGTGVRRLTPRECERLQALPDDWTAHGPDSRRYAALGDAVTASVAEWIGRRLRAVAA